MDLNLYSSEELYMLSCTLFDIIRRKEEEIKGVNELLATIHAEIDRQEIIKDKYKEELDG